MEAIWSFVRLLQSLSGLLFHFQNALEEVHESVAWCQLLLDEINQLASFADAQPDKLIWHGPQARSLLHFKQVICYGYIRFVELLHDSLGLLQIVFLYDPLY